jgi:hypothetical protein
MIFPSLLIQSNGIDDIPPVQVKVIY